MKESVADQGAHYFTIDVFKRRHCKDFHGTTHGEAYSLFTFRSRMSAWEAYGMLVLAEMDCFTVRDACAVLLLRFLSISPSLETIGSRIDIAHCHFVRGVATKNPWTAPSPSVLLTRGALSSLCEHIGTFEKKRPTTALLSVEGCIYRTRGRT